MLNTRQYKQYPGHAQEESDLATPFFSAILILFAIAGGYIFYRRKKARPVPPGKKIDLEIRYETEKDADATLLAQNIVKIVRMVLSPLERKIEKEQASLVFVFSGDSWEIRVRNGSAGLKQDIRNKLEAAEW